MSGALRVGACQTPEILGDVDRALSCVEGFASQATAHDVDLLLFPECFLQGYLAEEQHVRNQALDLGSVEFSSVLRRLSRIPQTLVLGLIERSGGRCFNSAVVITQAELAGVYRKTHLTRGEAIFDNGDAYPTFELHGVRFGINICYDTQFADAAASVAAQAARLLLVPAQNMMRRQAAAQWKDLHNQIRCERVRETGLWLVSSDVTGARDEHRIALGPTCVINRHAEIVARVPLMTTGIAIADIC